MRPSVPLVGVAALVLALSGCAVVPSAPPPPTPAPQISPVPPPPAPKPVLDWTNAPLTPGDWTYQALTAGSIARFGPIGGPTLLSLRCDLRYRRIILARAGASASPSLPVTVQTSYGALGWYGTPVTAQGQWIEVSRVGSDPGFDWMAFSRGRLAVEVQGMARLIVPAWPEIARVIEDCRG